MLPAAFESELGAIEAACAAIETAVRDRDWPLAEAADASLNASLARMQQKLGAVIGIVPERALELVAHRLRLVLANHERLTATIAALRDDAGRELDGARTGHRAAIHYLQTAGQSAGQSVGHTSGHGAGR